MGSFECYCALCSGPLGIYSIKLGSSKARHLARRKRRLLGEDVEHEESNESEDMEEKEDELARAAEVDEDEEMKDVATTETENDDGERENLDGEGEEEIEGEWQEDWDDDAQGSGLDAESEHESGDDDESEHESEHDEDGANKEGHTEVAPTIEENEDFSDNASQASELRHNDELDLAENAKDDTDSMFNYYEERSYDPTVITQEDVQWTDRSRALAINKEWKGEKKAFLSGRGRYEDYVSRAWHYVASSVST
jgi:hypothetical protein